MHKQKNLPLFMGLCIAIIPITIVIGFPVVHDYVFYIEDWNHILYGTERSLSKFDIPIAYGPLYYAMAFLHQIHYKLPHIFIIISWLLSSFLLLKKLKHQNQLYYIFSILMFLNPLIWFYVIYYGNIDIIACLFILYAFNSYDQNKYLVSGISLSLAVLLKFFPILFVPYFLFKKGKINWSFLKSFVFVFLFVISIFFLFSKENIIANFLYQASRASSGLSIFRYLRGEYSIAHLVSSNVNFDYLSIYLIVISQVLNIWLYIKYKIHYVLSATLAFTLLLAFHKTGNHQYYISLIYLIGYLYSKLIENKDFRFKKSSRFIFLLFVVIISVIPMIEFVLRSIFQKLPGFYIETIGLCLFFVTAIFMITCYSAVKSNLKKDPLEKIPH